MWFVGFEALAHRFSRLYERHFAFIFPAGSVVWELEAGEGKMDVGRRGQAISNHRY